MTLKSFYPSSFPDISLVYTNILTLLDDSNFFLIWFPEIIKREIFKMQSWSFIPLRKLFNSFSLFWTESLNFLTWYSRQSKNPKDIHVLIPRISEYVTSHGKTLSMRLRGDYSVFNLDEPILIMWALKSRRMVQRDM